MRNKRTAHKSLELIVVFDTNSIHNEEPNFLLNREAAEVISANADHLDLIIKWMLPHIVVNERRFQMLRAALALLPKTNKLHNLLGLTMLLDEEAIEDRVRDRVDEQMRAHGIREVQFAPDNVDWPRLVDNACFRRPPFDPGEKEKGFRDAIIAETFLQVVEASPSSSTSCLVVLVARDDLLIQAVTSRISDRKNVRTVSDLEGLRDLINTLANKISEETVASLREKAKKLFFDEGGAPMTGLIYKWEIMRRVKDKFSEELEALPDGADERRNGPWYISPPRFVKKERQRITWVSRIEVKAEAFRQTAEYSNPTPNYLTQGIDAPSDLSVSGTAGKPTPPWLTGGAADWRMALAGKARTTVAKGKSTTDVLWSASLAAHGGLVRPKCDDVLFEGTSWETI